MTFGNQRLETVPITKELKKLEKEIQNETKSGDYSFFNGVTKPEIENIMDYMYGDRLYTFWKWQLEVMHEDTDDLIQKTMK
jgi:hypothetical protein